MILPGTPASLKTVWTGLPKPPVFIVLCLLSLCLGFPDSQAQAHRATVFAWVEGGVVHTESGLSGGKAVQGGEILVYDQKGNLLLTGKTDENGLFSFPMPETDAGLRVVLKAGMGHQGEWTLTAGELGHTPAGMTPSPPEAATDAAVPHGQTLPDRFDEKRLRALMEETLDAKLKPLFRLLAESRRTGPSVSDVLGGIGYIIGLVGLGAYIRYRRSEKTPHGRSGRTER